jgi:hypothetical protein
VVVLVSPTRLGLLPAPRRLRRGMAPRRGAVSLLCRATLSGCYGSLEPINLILKVDEQISKGYSIGR